MRKERKRELSVESCEVEAQSSVCMIFLKSLSFVKGSVGESTSLDDSKS